MAERVLRIKRRRWLPMVGVGGAILLVAVGGTYVANGVSAGSETAALRTGQVTTGSIEQTLTLTGSVTRVSQMTAHFPVAGTVTGVSVAVGDVVTAGQALATLDTGPLNQAVLDAKSTLDQAKATLANDTTTASSSSSSSSASSSGTSSSSPTSSSSRTSASSSPSTSAGGGGGGGGQNQTTSALAAVAAAEALAKTACAPVLPVATATSTSVPTSRDLDRHVHADGDLDRHLDHDDLAPDGAGDC
ncbi:MAG: biotin/lipoyl-binding protein [Actinomycetales bacterium]|uniref:Biotin/lipoyl-binding protein n=1 Tax=Candidatus Phosphoribacter hodrii TaxID=2953743 RepID=A0A935CFY9_9MICO|nr:biotin/lipoyl-binding protein [Candidatus Phosphoribacter hodrii]